MTIDVATLLSPIRNTRFATLRPAQREAIELYAAGASESRDIAIELPTGGGKTLIALLILEYWRNLGHSVAILTGNKTLAYQLRAEANDLRVPTVIFEGSGLEFAPKDKRDYERGKAIAIMNYWVYINQNPRVASANYLVLDDAQLAEGALDSLYSLRISRWEHEALFEQVMQLISQYSDSPVADDFVKKVDQGPWGITDLVHFSNVMAMWEEFDQLIEGAIKRDSSPDPEMTSVKFQWKRIRPNGRQALMFVDSDEITLRPYIYPTKDYSHLSSPSQRIFMSATLHDLEDLRRRLGTSRIEKLAISDSSSSGDDGRKLFVFNQTTTAITKTGPSPEALVPLTAILNEIRKSVWLCSSRREANKWKAWVENVIDPKDPTFELSPMGDEIERFCEAPVGHLFIAGRFEGMDFPGDACRLAVFPSLPVATGALERFTTEQLKDARFQQARMLERVKQGVGRCTRGKEDFAVYYFLDTRATTELESKPFASLVSDRTRKQVEVGLELTQDGMGTVVPAVAKFLRADFSEFDARESKVKLPSFRDSTGWLSRDVSHEVEGWRALFGSRNLLRASQEFESVWQGMADSERELRGFWIYMQAHAEYLRHKLDGDELAKGRCLNLLESAVMEGGSASWFNRLRKSLNELKGAAMAPLPEHDAILDRWDELAVQYPHHKGRFLQWQARLKGNLDGTHAQVCEALESIGSTLGFNATRPKGNGFEDGRWEASDHIITFEAKIELERDFIALTDVNQAAGHGRGLCKILGFNPDNIASVIVTPAQAIEPDADRSIGTVRVIKMDLIEELQSRLEAIMREYWRGWIRHDAHARMSLRAAASKSLPPRHWLLRAIKGSKGPFIDGALLFSEWPK